MVNIFEKIFGEKIATKSEIKTIPAQGSLDVGDELFKTRQFYFDIRLCEIYLRTIADGGKRFVPRAISITECQYDQSAPLVLPMVVGNHLIAKIREMTGVDDEDPLPITFRNFPLAGPMPYRGGDIGLVSGLYRVEAGNVVDSAIDLVAEVTGSLGLNLTKYIDISRQVANHLPSILGANSGSWRLLHYAPIYKPADAFFDRFLVLIGDEGEPFDADALVVHTEDDQESLYSSSGGKSIPFNARDYLLLRLRSSPERNDHERFEYQKRFGAIKKHLMKGELAQAEWAHMELNDEIISCPDLTDNDQCGQILYFKKLIDKWKEDHGLVEKYKEVEHRGGVRAAGDEVITGGLASTALNNPKWFSKDLYKSLENLRESWGELDALLEPDLDKLLDSDAESEITSEMVNRFSREAAKTRVGNFSAAELADVIKVHTLSLN